MQLEIEYTDGSKKIIIKYLANQELNVAQTRALFVSIMDGLLSTINASTEIRLYLLDYPFTWKNIDLDYRLKLNCLLHINFYLDFI